MKMLGRTCLLVLLLGAAVSVAHGGDRPGNEGGPSPMLLGILENSGIDADDPAALVKAAASHPDLNIRWAAVEVLGLRKETRSRPILLKIVGQEQEDRIVRETAALALARMGDEAGMTALKNFMESSVERNRQLFLAARLAELGDASGYEHVAQAAEGKDASLREAAVEALPPFLRFARNELAGNSADLLLVLARDENAQVRRQVLVFLPLAVGEGLDPQKARLAAQRIAEGDPEPDLRESAELLLKTWHIEDCQRNPDKGDCQ